MAHLHCKHKTAETGFFFTLTGLDKGKMQTKHENADIEIEAISICCFPQKRKAHNEGVDRGQRQNAVSH